MIKDCVGELATNRGFRSEMAFGELTLKIGISSDDETEGEEEPSVGTEININNMSTRHPF